MSDSAATSGEFTFSLNATVTSDIDLAPMLAAHWRARHICRLAGGARYWKRRRVPRWVQAVESADRIMRAMREFEKYERVIGDFKEVLEDMHATRITTTDNTDSP